MTLHSDTTICDQQQLKYPILISTLFLLSCEKRGVKEYGLNDMVIGTQQFVMYDNGEFYLELSLGGVEGIYTERNDTIFLNYLDVVDSAWPDRIRHSARAEREGRIYAAAGTRFEEPRRAP